MIRKRIYLQGNSCVISLPRYLLEELGARLGDSMEIDVIAQGQFVATVRSKQWVEDQARRLWHDASELARDVGKIEGG